MLEQITAACTEHGEGPIWDLVQGQLVFVDMHRGDLLVLDAVGNDPVRHHVSEVAACVVPRRGGGLALAVERGLALLDDDWKSEELPELWPDATVRMNDGACDPAGRFFVGSMAYDESPGKGSLWCFDHSLNASVAIGGVTISNGLGWSPDGGTAYFVDSPTQRIDAMDYDQVTGSFSERRKLVEIPAALGMPDGLTVDAEGGIWVALWGGGALHRYDAHGTQTDNFPVPTLHPTSCAFGGDALNQFFVTTSTAGMNPSDDQSAGALFWMHADFQGLPCATFDG